MAKQEWYKGLPWIRLLIITTAILLLSAGALLWIFDTGRIIQGGWSYILPPLFTVIGIALTIVAWLFPFIPEQSKVPLLPLARELVRGSFRMGDNLAANFPYITTPIQNVYHAAMRAVLDASTAGGIKRGILILGEANAGKTRMALEVLMQTLPNWSVLVCKPEPTMLQTPSLRALRSSGLVVFIDDLQAYVPSEIYETNIPLLMPYDRATTLETLYSKMFEMGRPIVIMATCRLEDELRVRAVLGRFFVELEVIELPSFNEDKHDHQTTQIIDEFQSNGPIHIQDWDGTLGSLVLGLSTKNQEYLKIRNNPAATILRAMKLLMIANILEHTEQRLRAVCAGVFGEKALLTDEKTWQEAVNQLTEYQFVKEELDEVRREVTLRIRKDTYFDQVITDYPIVDRPHQLIRHFILLQDVLVDLRDATAIVNLGIALLTLESYEQALNVFEQAIQLAQSNASAYMNKATALAFLKCYEQALDVFEQAIQLDPTVPLAFHNKGTVLAELGRSEEALIAYEQAIRLDPNEYHGYFNKGNALSQLKRYEEALTAYEQAIHLVSNDADLYYEMGKVLNQLNRYEEALAAFERAIRLNPKNALTYSEKGYVLDELGRSEEALIAYEQAIRLDPNEAVIYHAKGIILAQLKQYEEALTAFEQVICLEPNQAVAYNNKAQVLNQLKRYEEALTACEHAILLDPNDAFAYNYKGLILAQLERYEEALTACEKSIQLDPYEADTYHNLANILRSLGREEEAKKMEKTGKTIDKGIIYIGPGGKVIPPFGS